jgi:2-desacetyl-2-hydroxyethyl bacteriochlorophyllide A dehydrogenase
MRCVVLKEPHHLELREVPQPTPGPGEALLRIRRVGVCGTDLHAFRGRQPYFAYPRVLGHELAAEVVDPGPSDWKPGETCAVLPYLSCGGCVACRQGKTNCCTTLKVLGVHIDGGLQDLLALPAANLLRPEGLSPEQCALVENQSIGAHAVRRAQLRPGEWALVIGAGAIGIGAMQFARLDGARVIAMDLDAGRLEFCRRWLGVEHTLCAAKDPAAHLAELTGGEMPTAVFEATGNPASMTAAFTLVAHGGRLVLVSIVQADITFSDPEFHKRELSVLSSRNATREDFARVMEGMRSGQVVIGPMTTHRVGIAELPSALPEWITPGSGLIKAMVDL